VSDLERKRERRAALLKALAALFVLVLVAIAVSFGTVGIVCSQRASNERNASTSLKTLASGEADFRANDRDWNHVNDFWTADVKGLYTLTSGAVRGANPASTSDPSIKLIELSIAAADGDGTFFSAGGENLPLTAFATPMAKAGYWYAALLTDRTLAGSLEMTYAQDTEGKPPMGSVHNTSKFGFAAFPDSSGSGKYIFFVNENNTIFREATTGARTGKEIPPGRKGLDQTWQHWPDDRPKHQPGKWD
jgi:hypothetical protein